MNHKQRKLEPRTATVFLMKQFLWRCSLQKQDKIKSPLRQNRDGLFVVFFADIFGKVQFFSHFSFASARMHSISFSSFVSEINRRITAGIFGYTRCYVKGNGLFAVCHDFFY